MRDLSALIKAYDIRGIVPEQWDAKLSREVGIAFVEVLKIRAIDGGTGRIVVGHDMRPTGPDLVAAFIDGVTGAGVDVINIGLCSTDGLYFASGRLDIPGAMFTASHNPAEYNGIKLCRAGAAPVGQDSGLSEIRELLESEKLPKYSGAAGSATQKDMLADYAQYLRELVPLEKSRKLKVVIDTGNGMGGFTVPAVLGGEIFAALPLEIEAMYFELDGTFPNHEANPIDPENLRDLQKRVLEVGADVGLAFDGDADRCFVVDEKGGIVDPSTLTALIATRELAKAPGSTIIHNLITSRAVPEIVLEHGGIPVRTRVGHSFIKATMAQSNAIFGGEHSGHFYFRDFWKADSGMLAAMHALAALGEAPKSTTLSELLKPYLRYKMSGEINTKVSDAKTVVARIKTEFAGRATDTDELDGLTVSLDSGWFNVRSSNTEPLLRLNVEATNQDAMAAIRDEVLGIMNGSL
ncbi:MAG: phosphomannomutase/phosphoglucomutase [Candidatus Nanopelagicales bacterium]|nr:phosphomannomutase/phosphoglucomutase [Candidatus Nanopelagicales bacterium]